MLGFKRELQTKRKLNKLVFSNASKNVQNVIQVALKQLFFSRNFQTITHSLRRLEAPPPDPVGDTFELH